MAKILFVDNVTAEFERFQERVPFGREHKAETEHLRSPVGLAARVASDPEVRLVILDILWEEGATGEDALELGAHAMRDLAKAGPEVPVVIYSVIQDEASLRRLIPEMMTLGAFDWVSKDDNLVVRSFRFERAYKAGRGWRGLQPKSQAVLPADVEQRSDVHVAVMFVDLSGFTALTDQIGASEVVRVLRKYYKLVGECVEEHDGYVDKYIGDAVMVVFGLRDTKVDNSYHHSQRCVAAARSIVAKSQEFRLKTIEPALTKSRTRLTEVEFPKIGQMRVGCESGVVEVIRFPRGNESEITVIGSAVNIAARIMAKSEGDQIWIGHNLKGTGGNFTTVDQKPAEYKNLPGVFQIYQVRV